MWQWSFSTSMTDSELCTAKASKLHQKSKKHVN